MVYKVDVWLVQFSHRLFLRLRRVRLGIQQDRFTYTCQLDVSVGIER